MSNIKGAVVINTERCKGCELCIVACPLNLLTLSAKKVNHKGYPYAIQQEWEKCTGCTACAVVCPDGCINVYRKKEN
ncbi:MAG: 4Fe-4S binding protein [Bacteroidaceae bacterium]|nr:4Fe-4S binding protein [Prevotellaceae bacterium]MDY2849080.1 4Fe-4S binding protein [Bacteroidaceae bacterium]